MTLVIGTFIILLLLGMPICFVLGISGAIFLMTTPDVSMLIAPVKIALPWQMLPWNPAHWVPPC